MRHVNPKDFTRVKQSPFLSGELDEIESPMRLRKHLRQYRKEELRLLAQLRLEARRPEWLDER